MRVSSQYLSDTTSKKPVRLLVPAQPHLAAPCAARGDQRPAQPVQRALPGAPVLLDAGCGQGKSFKHLQQVFAPAPDRPRRRPHSLELSREEATRQGLPWS
jgi:hypothetical protein